MDTQANVSGEPTGEFFELEGERYYAIRNVDRMAPFFISVISGFDHWLFVSSACGLTAGRVCPDQALFPYVPVDKIHDSSAHTGSKTIFLVSNGSGRKLWEPFNYEHDGRFELTRTLYKNILGNKLCFEEINHNLNFVFRYTWTTSEQYGFVRQCQLRNLSRTDTCVEIIDGLQNILPAGTPGAIQTTASNLVDAYKWNELDPETGLAIYALYAGISDRAEPCESLRATAVFSLGLGARTILISSSQLDAFRDGGSLDREVHKRGLRGAYFIHSELNLAAGSSQDWSIVADVELTQGRVARLRSELRDPEQVATALVDSVEKGGDELARIMASVDGYQATAEENVSVHHYANALFNVLRGGVFNDQYRVRSHDLERTIRRFNRTVYARHADWLRGLPETLDARVMLESARERGDLQLERLCQEYLPITFGRRHGDPSRPWNRFTIKLKDERGDPLLHYEGNWRDIFQNWEALAFSFPEFTESVIAKFVNASTVDGYNPYRITKDGIDWEVEEPDDPWSYIGYWGDHQIIYLLKLLELSYRFHPTTLGQLLGRPIFSYANVPYRIRPFEAIVANPKETVEYDQSLAELIARRVEDIGADGRLVVDAQGDVCQVNLLEKLLVPLLCKLGNFVPEGGIWLNTQRPEWNDANNALVGHGLSVVTLCYLRRYARFLQDLLARETGSFELSDQVNQWVTETTDALVQLNASGADAVSDKARRFAAIHALGTAAERYRSSVYPDRSFAMKVPRPVSDIAELLDAALRTIDQSIRFNRRQDGLYHTYNLLKIEDGEASVDTLGTMLEGQVAALSSGSVAPDEAVALLEAMFESDIYRADQKSFMLYPDRPLPGFLEKNRVPASHVHGTGVLRTMLESGDERLVSRDVDDVYRFNADLTNANSLDELLARLAREYGETLTDAAPAIRALYEEVFNHRAFTGRSGTMFGFEGLGCIYWHMVSKLLLAVQEQFFDALDNAADEDTCRRLGDLYYRVRDGLGFNKSPAEYGAFPTDPYSHTTGHSGARQPGMTGQVKEEVLTRFGELGLRVVDGCVRFEPALLRSCEFLDRQRTLRYVDVDGSWQSLDVLQRTLAFTWCQVPILYRLSDRTGTELSVAQDNGETIALHESSLSPHLSSEIFRRSGRVRQITLALPPGSLS